MPRPKAGAFLRGKLKMARPVGTGIEICAAVAVTALAVGLPTSWWCRVVLLLAAEGIVADLVWLSPLMTAQSRSRKICLALIGAALLLAVGWKPVRDGYVGAERPDVTFRFVYPLQPSLLLINNSGKVARDIKYSFLLWNLDRPDLATDRNPLQIPAAGFDYIRPHERSGAIALFASAGAESDLEPGNRIFGVGMVTCPDCTYTRSFWIYIVWKRSGWIAELPHDRHVDLDKLASDLPKVAGNIEGFFSTTRDRIRIENRSP